MLNIPKYKFASYILRSIVGPAKCENFINTIKNPYSKCEDQFNCVFIHVPKAAGKAVSKALLGASNGTGHNKLICYERYPKKFKKYRKISVVRNPWDRLVSAFFYLKSMDSKTNDGLFFKKNIGQNTGFDDFVRMLRKDYYRDTILEWEHFTPQYKFLVNSDGLIELDYVARFESLENDYEYLKKMVNADAAPLRKLNASKRNNYKDYYNPVTIEIVREIYKKDIELFNYNY